MTPLHRRRAHGDIPANPHSARHLPTHLAGGPRATVARPLRFSNVPHGGALAPRSAACEAEATRVTPDTSCRAAGVFAGAGPRRRAWGRASTPEAATARRAGPRPRGGGHLGRPSPQLRSAPRD